MLCLQDSCATAIVLGGSFPIVSVSLNQLVAINPSTVLESMGE